MCNQFLTWKIFSIGALMIRSEDAGFVVITGVMSRRYLCMDFRGNIFGSHLFSPESCRFRQRTLENGYDVYHSPQHRFLVSLGQAKRAFLPAPTRRPTRSSCPGGTRSPSCTSTRPGRGGTRAAPRPRSATAERAEAQAALGPRPGLLLAGAPERRGPRRAGQRPAGVLRGHRANARAGGVGVDRCRAFPTPI
uniref:Fibroblast growth factor 23 n=1 Tax=Canis lupus familiaris TaxID=9615 RepID=A0A8C0TN51_CANLF